MGYYKKKSMHCLSGLASFATIRTKPATLANRNSNRSTKKPKSIRAMRAVVQRVASASVEVSLSLALNFVGLILRRQRMIAYILCIVQVEGRIVSEIGPGLLVLVGLHESDSDSDADYMFVFYL